jgi:hypothetical protein
LAPPEAAYMCEGPTSGCSICYGCEGYGDYQSCMDECVLSICDPECSADECESCIDGQCDMRCRLDLCYDCDGAGNCVYQCAAGETCCSGTCCPSGQFCNNGQCVCGGNCVWEFVGEAEAANFGWRILQNNCIGTPCICNPPQFVPPPPPPGEEAAQELITNCIPFTP